MKTCKYEVRGFSLVEMAIVLVIIGLLLGGMLMPLSAQMEQRRVAETQKALDEINQALIGFAVANRRLPCPANPMLVEPALNTGVERGFAAGVCTGGNNGVLPWATLGVAETDSWGNRYTYYVTNTFANNVPPPPFLTLAAVGDATVRPAPGSPATLTAAIPAVVISHGKNGFGAYNTSGTQLPVSADAGEAENSNADAGAEFVSRTPTETFDDLVAWVSPNILFNRMVTAGVLP